MRCDLHHAHLFASDLDRSIRFYTEFFNGRVVLDLEMAGARNVFLRLGQGRLHFYDQPPRHPVRGNIHHIGIQTDDLEGMVAKLRAGGVPLKKEIKDYGFWKYVMVPAPDEVLIELFQVDRSRMTPDLTDYFS
ncbi:MAG: VOC family protein [Deltaproteobacteria bacterium]|nr:VOC family protein [Deltaproteobacteria bacterium]